MNLILASDDRGVDMMAVAIYSIIKNNPSHKLKFYIIHSSITETNINRLKVLEQTFSNTTIQFIKADYTKFRDLEVTNRNVTMEAYYRYLAPDILQGEERALYIDFDMLCLSDLGELYSTEMGDNYIAAVKEYFVTDDNPSDNYLYKKIRKAIGLKKEEVYINSGLLLMNLKLMRESGIMETFWDNIKNKATLLPGRTNHFADQTITNLTFRSRIKNLDPKYNVYTTALAELSIKEPAIVHFTGQKKPMTYLDDTSTVYDDTYLKYYNDCVRIIGYAQNHLIKTTIVKIRADLNFQKQETDVLYKTQDGLRALIIDKEQEVARLHREQRDVRLLAKRFAKEIQIRINRRAQGLNIGNHLHYKQSDMISKLSESKKITKKELGIVQGLDRENIQTKQISINDRIKPIAWKLAAVILNLGVKTAKGMRNYVR